MLREHYAAGSAQFVEHAGFGVGGVHVGCAEQDFLRAERGGEV